MVDIRFEGDYTTPATQRQQQKSSRITQFFIDHSFGLITTPARAATVQVVVAMLLFIFAGYLFSKSGDTVVPTRTSQELIDATLLNNAR